MSLIVAKFGGTSVASPERIQMVAKKVIAKKQAGHDVVAVVSAMGKTTDELVGLARAYGDVRAAAEALHQHPNTVRYRLRRAKAVLGMPDAPDREFAFLLGLVFLDRTNPLLGS